MSAHKLCTSVVVSWSNISGGSTIQMRPCVLTSLFSPSVCVFYKAVIFMVCLMCSCSGL